jgi:SAM-dependent methyltransferase
MDRHALDPGHKARLTPRLAHRFSSSSLFDKVARALCEIGLVPRKELYESWEVARRARRRFRGGRVVDLACGHALTAHLMLLLDDSSKTALAVDTRVPPVARAAHEALERAWPRLHGRVALLEEKLENVPLTSDDVVVSCHACGALTDAVIARAVAARARVAVLPCCHDLDACDAGSLTGWIDAPTAIDIRRAAWLERQRYRIWTQTIPASVTPKNRLLLGEPLATEG